MMKIISGIRGGGHPTTMAIIFNALLRSSAEYGASIVGNASKTNKEKLQITLNDAMRRATGCSRTTPRNTLLAIAAQEPWQFRSDYVTCKETARVVHYRNPVYKQLRKVTETQSDSRKLSYMEKLYSEHQEIFNNISPMVRTTITDVHIATGIGIRCTKANTNPRVLKQAVLGILSSQYIHSHRVYTDASKMGERCGIGIYLESTKRKIALTLNTETCIMTAELIAIYTATQEIKQSQMSKSVIITDSLSSCTLLQNNLNLTNRSKIIDDILKACKELNIQIQWIPSHIDILGNDIADELAKMGAESNDIDKLFNTILLRDSYLYFKKIKQARTNSWYKKYEEENAKGLKFYNIQSEFCEKPWYHKLGLTNSTTRTINRLMAGHDYSKYWLHKMKLVDDPFCEICDQLETAEHIILHCNRYNDIRSKFSFVHKFQSIVDLLKTKNTLHFEEIIEFLKQSKMKL
ncbi:uncharacterized protein LOC129748100 [Uranotaenia lowii]|uniref:uncharacterized protein LOC129748100 n=1 Tax=Uranotaenia lowii TaxID=190385 RepID=UPI00247917BA|nr:uncharacterized protein LOC129748100 [Uranotaenia lowii]XP_055598561.1 uncharacterized protein LOC129748100 [Uranotaenia lowii]XP_055598572.1 uncharacterized protein LOC129748100 [Uranotaenia lowii]XP_055598581.1 uncharacterized protein LOC129748100 [Uranotaenia lowii]XP_055598587.1 uncharacterized protein LOC129748100 [Uranotaenia lowii]